MQQQIRNSTALQLILFFFPKKLRLTVCEVAQLINRCEQGIRNDLSDSTFSIPSYKENGRRYFDIRDVAEFIDAKYANEAAASNNAGMKKSARTGRPSKTEAVKAYKLGISVKQLRAQVGGEI